MTDRYVKPVQIEGVWSVPTSADPLCLVCRYSEPRPRGGLLCQVDPRNLTNRATCRAYEREPGIEG